MRIFNLDNPAMTADVIRGIQGADGHTGNAVAKAGCACLAGHDREAARPLQCGVAAMSGSSTTAMGQAVDQVRVQGCPDDFAAKVLPLLDRRRYLNEDGDDDDAGTGFLPILRPHTKPLRRAG